MAKLPNVTAKVVASVLESIGFQTVRQKGSHLRMRHIDGRVVTVPIHDGQTLGKGLLLKILRDAELTKEAFIDLLQ